MNRIELAFAANGKFFDGLLVTAVSAARFARKDCALGFSILDGGIDEKDFELLERRIKDFHPESLIRRFHVDESEFKDFPLWTGNRMAYARFLLPELLHDVNFVIYSDVDYLWLRDVAELWEQRDDRVPLQGTLDGNDETLNKEARWFAKHGLPFDSCKYICSGFLFMNLRLFREENIVGKLGAFLIKYPDVQFPDQAALNVVLKDRIRLVPQSWQRFTSAVTNDELKNPIALHYAGDAPWRVGRWLQMLTDQRKAWFEILSMIKGTSFSFELKRYYGRLSVALFRRWAFWVCTTPGLRSLFFIFLCLTGRNVYRPFFAIWSKRLDFSKYVCCFAKECD